MTEVRCLECANIFKSARATELRLNVANVKFSTATPKALQVSHLEQTGGDMTVYNSSASASYATIDVKSQVVTSDQACLTSANKIRYHFVV